MEIFLEFQTCLNGQTNINHNRYFIYFSIYSLICKIINMDKFALWDITIEILRLLRPTSFA